MTAKVMGIDWSKGVGTLNLFTSVVKDAICLFHCLSGYSETISDG